MECRTPAAFTQTRRRYVCCANAVEMDRAASINWNNYYMLLLLNPQTIIDLSLMHWQTDFFSRFNPNGKDLFDLTAKGLIPFNRLSNEEYWSKDERRQRLYE